MRGGFGVQPLGERLGRRRDATRHHHGAGGTHRATPMAQAGRTAPHPTAQAGRTTPPPRHRRGRTTPPPWHRRGRTAPLPRRRRDAERHIPTATAGRRAPHPRRRRDSERHFHGAGGTPSATSTAQAGRRAPPPIPLQQHLGFPGRVGDRNSRHTRIFRSRN